MKKDCFSLLCSRKLSLHLPAARKASLFKNPFKLLPCTSGGPRLRVKAFERPSERFLRQWERNVTETHEHAGEFRGW